MNIEVGLTYAEPDRRRLDIVVDGEPRYVTIMNVAAGFRHDLPIGEHFLSIRIDAAPHPDLPENDAKARQ